MSFTDLFTSGTHSRNLAHFASIANIAAVHGEIHENEEKLLKRFARKLDVSEHEYEAILKNPSKYPINSSNSADERLERMLDFFKMIFLHDEKIFFDGIFFKFISWSRRIVWGRFQNVPSSIKRRKTT